MEDPGQKETPDAPKAAAARLEEMGPMTTPQKVMSATLAGAVVLWMFGDVLGVSAVVAAMMGLTVLLLTGVLDWEDCLGYKPAWDTLTWCVLCVLCMLRWTAHTGPCANLCRIRAAPHAVGSDPR